MTALYRPKPDSLKFVLWTKVVDEQLSGQPVKSSQHDCFYFDMSIGFATSRALVGDELVT